MLFWAAQIPHWINKGFNQSIVYRLLLALCEESRERFVVIIRREKISLPPHSELTSHLRQKGSLHTLGGLVASGGEGSMRETITFGLSITGSCA